MLPVENPKIVDLITDENDVGYYLAFDDFLTTVCLGISTAKPVNAKQFIACIEKFLDDVKTDQIDLESVFSSYEGFEGVIQ